MQELTPLDQAVLNHIIQAQHNTLLEQGDWETVEHMKREVKFAEAIANIFDLPPEEQRILEASVLLHDIGKSQVPLELRKKAGPLDAHEKTQFERHVDAGVQMLLSDPLLAKLSPECCGTTFNRILMNVAYHHTYYNLTGYGPAPCTPHTRKQIPQLAFILHAADMLEASTSPHRPYHSIMGKSRKTPLEARDEITRLSGKQFSPQVARAVARIQFPETFSLDARLRNDRCLGAIKKTVNSVARQHCIPPYTFSVRKEPAQSAALRVTYETPVFAGEHITSAITGNGTHNNEDYNVSILADEPYDTDVFNLIQDLAALEGFNPSEQERIRRVFEEIIPHHIPHHGKYAPRSGNTFTVIYDTSTNKLRVQVRNPSLAYCSDWRMQVLRPMQTEIFNFAGHTVVPRLKSKTPVFEVVMDAA